MRLLDATGGVELAREAAADHLARDGLVLIHGGSVAGVRALLAEWTESFPHPHDHESGLTILSPSQGSGELPGRAGFSRAPLSPHTDRSLQPEPPAVLATVMMSPCASGGDALLADGATVLAALHRTAPAHAVSRLHLRAAAGDSAPIITIQGELAKIRFRDDSLARPWSEDGDQRWVDELRELISAATKTLPLLTGEGYLLHNHRYLHGRSSFTGHRRLARMLATVTCGRLAWLNQGFRVAYP